MGKGAVTAALAEVGSRHDERETPRGPWRGGARGERGRSGDTGSLLTSFPVLIPQATPSLKSTSSTPLLSMKVPKGEGGHNKGVRGGDRG